MLRTMHASRSRISQERRDRYSYARRERGRTKNNVHEVTDKVFDGLRDAKHYASAALASGKLVLMEQKLKKLEGDRERQKLEQVEEKRQKRQRMDAEKVKRIQTQRGNDGGMHGVADEQTPHFASNIGALPGDEIDGHFESDDEFDNIGGFSDDEEDFLQFVNDDDDYDDSHDELEQELQHIQHQKAYSALLNAHQMEALWKITKIELDHTIREACISILKPTAFFSSPPPPTSSHHRHHRRHNYHHRMHHSRHRSDGWIGATGEGVSMEVGRLRAAAAMILVGDIMVQCSKEGTAWSK